MLEYPDTVGKAMVLDLLQQRRVKHTTQSNTAEDSSKLKRLRHAERRNRRNVVITPSRIGVRLSSS